MSEPTVSAASLRDRLDGLGVDVDDGASTSAYTDLDTSVNLNAVAIGLGLDDVVYEPDRFPGIVYEPDAYEETVVVVFGNGTLFVDSSASVGVDEVVGDVTEQLVDIGLLSDPGRTTEFSLTPTDVPVPPEYEGTGDEAEAGRPPEADDGADADDAAGACDNCGHALSGGENFCPECGEAVTPSCPSCGFELAGGENFCPECGTGLTAG